MPIYTIECKNIFLSKITEYRKLCVSPYHFDLCNKTDYFMFDSVLSNSAIKGDNSENVL